MRYRRRNRFPYLRSIGITFRTGARYLGWKYRMESEIVDYVLALSHMPRNKEEKIQLIQS